MDCRPTVLLALLTVSFMTVGACQRGQVAAESAQEERGLNPNGPNPGKMVPRSDGNIFSAHDRDVAYDLESKNVEEVDLAKYVKEGTKNSQVKSFADKIIDDHSQALSQIRELLKQNGINQPAMTTPKDELSKTTALRNTPPDQIDRNYLGMMVEEHQKDIDELKSDEATVSNSELKQYIQKLIPKLDEHLREAERIEGDFKKTEKR